MAKNPSPPVHKEDPDLQRRFEAYKLEYQLAAERYENIYRAIWQNFSYMAILAGGILTFGAKTLPLYWVWFLSLMPLLFWFCATYLPMDHYARGARKRAADIERILTSEFLKLDLAGDDVVDAPTKQIRHFRDFGLEDPMFHWGKKGKLRFKGLPPHVNQIMLPVGGLLILCAVGLLGFAVFGSARHSSPQRVAIDSVSRPLQVQLRTAADQDSIGPQLSGFALRLDRIDARTVTVDSILRAVLACMKNAKRGQCP